MKFQVILPKQVQKQLNRMPDEVTERILIRLAALETAPRPPDVKKLKGREAWRIRVEDYRVVYEIHEQVLRVIVIAIGHRRDIYR